MPAMSAENRGFWQDIANRVSRQRPYPGRTAMVIRGRKLRGETVTVLQHKRDAYSQAFRYGSDGNLAMREMQGRAGYVCLVQNEAGERKWIKAPYLMCQHAYTHWTEALSDAVTMSVSAY